MKLKKNPSVMMVAGEVSGDMHAARVIRALKSKRKKINIFGMGGPQMAEAGMQVREDLTRQALIGFWEVLKHYPWIKRRFDQCEKWLREEKPDLLFLIDYPGFNLRLAQKAHQLGIPVCYYVAPQVWAWKKSRIQTMKKIISKLLVILPFEKEFLAQEGMPSVYVGHPLMEEMDFKNAKREKTLQKHGIEAARFPLICAMPGSRQGEVEKIWPLYLEAARKILKSFPDAGFIVPKPAGLNYEDYAGLSPDDPFFFVEAPAYDLRRICDLAWVKSGTGTLETALLKTPMIVTYKVAPVTGFLARRFLKIKYVSLVNILAGEGLVPELLQEKARAEILAEETLVLLERKPVRDKQLKGFGKILKKIASPPKASQNVAREILKLLAGIS
jgi:lipid-A-disaccharide synthase